MDEFVTSVQAIQMMLLVLMCWAVFVDFDQICLDETYSFEKL